MPRDTLTIGRNTVEVSNLDKILYPEDGISKGEFISYYERIADLMLPHVQGRLITLQRFPEGIDDGRFYQKQPPDYFPGFVNRVKVQFKDVGRKRQFTCDNKETLVFLANQVCIPHIWLSRIDNLDYPDRMIFDLDPPGDDFEPVRYAALILREILREVGLDGFVMTTGSRGLHVTVPLDRQTGFSAVRTFSQGIADVLVRMAPEHFTSEFRKDKRGGKLFVDTYRNAFSQTAVAPYAVRARPGAPVAAPLEWKELSRKKINARTFTIRNLFERLEKKGDLLRGIFEKSYSLNMPQRRLKEML